MAFFEDPRLRQRWNQITHDAETVTENAAAGIFSFSQNYINPCFSSIANSIEQCTTVCLGDPEDRLRRRRERQRARDNAEFSFDFYDDWYQEEQSGGILGSWGGEDWDRLLAGTGAARKHGGGETSEQPRRKRGMSYGTRGGRRKASTAEDPTIIPSTQPIGFLSKLPWKMGGTLRYKPSAADLQDHPGKHDRGEAAPLLGGQGDEDDDSDYGQVLRMPRQRSGTTGSGGTSDSYRSRGDLFPSDGEGEEDAVPLDDDVTYDMVRRDDRSSGKTRSSKGKRPAGQFGGSRNVSRSTLGSTGSADTPEYERRSSSQPPTPSMAEIPSIENMRGEEGRTQYQEHGDKLSGRRGSEHEVISQQRPNESIVSVQEVPEVKPDMEVQVDEIYPPPNAMQQEDERASSIQGGHDGQLTARSDAAESIEAQRGQNEDDGLEMMSTSASNAVPSFHAARLPRFG